MDILKNMAEENLLLNWFAAEGNNSSLNVNNHIHTPYSFSAFESIEQAFQLAKKEDIQVLGINDFYVSDGYEEFYHQAVNNNIFPIFNVEFIGLLKEEQSKGIRVNDPNNPGRTYFSGKGMAYPVKLTAKNQLLLDGLIIETQKQIVDMIEKTNELLSEISAPFSFTYEEIKLKLAKKLVRERHIAKALRINIHEHFKTEKEIKDFLNKLYSGKESKADVNDNAALENELRSQLLKAGGRAFVTEDESAFLEIPKVIDFIVQAKGIPTYPVLLDDSKGNYTEFEQDKKALLNRLKELNVASIELIPNRNSIKALKPFVEFFRKENFLVSFGTEHNSPDLTPLSIFTRDGKNIDSELKNIGFDSTAVIAAHQYLVAKGEEGYIDTNGSAKASQINEFIELGKAVIEKYLN